MRRTRGEITLLRLRTAAAWAELLLPAALDWVFALAFGAADFFAVEDFFSGAALPFASERVAELEVEDV